MQGHVFISYVRQDSALVDRLQHELEAAGIKVWRDISRVRPGQDWQMEIQQAITRGALVFVACFSDASAARKRTEQLAELALAAKEYRRRPPGRPWLIPVRFSDCELPVVDLGPDKTLDALHRLDLFGDQWDTGRGRLVAEIRRLLDGDEPLDAATPETDHPALAPTEATGGRPRSVVAATATATAIAVVVLVAAVVMWAGADRSKDDGEGDSPGSTPAAAPPPNRCSRQFTTQAAIQPGLEWEERGNLVFGDVAGYTVAANDDDSLSIQAGGGVVGSIPEGYTLYLLGASDPEPDADPPGQVPGPGRFSMSLPLEPLPGSGCWEYSRPRVGYAGWCGVTSSFTFALVTDAAEDQLLQQAHDPTDPAFDGGFPLDRMGPPDISRLATFEVPSAQLC